MSAALIPITIRRTLAGLGHSAPAVFLPDAKTAECFFGFFMPTSGIRILGAAIQNHGERHRHAASHDAAGCLRDVPTACAGGRHSNQDRQSFIAGNRHYRLPEKQRHA